MTDDADRPPLRWDRHAEPLLHRGTFAVGRRRGALAPARPGPGTVVWLRAGRKVPVAWHHEPQWAWRVVGVVREPTAIGPLVAAAAGADPEA